MNNKKAVAVLVACVDSVVMERNASSKANTIDCTLAQPTLLGFRKTDTATKTADGNLIYGNDRVGGEVQKQAELAGLLSHNIVPNNCQNLARGGACFTARLAFACKSLLDQTSTGAAWVPRSVPTRCGVVRIVWRAFQGSRLRLRGY
jgi:hypothetical protein